MTLQGKHVIIIGGSAGIGLATAIAVSREGAHVTIASRSEDRLNAAKKKIGGSVTAKRLDARNEAEMQQFFSEIETFDHLVTPGSSTSPGSCIGLDTEIARDSFNSKFWGQYFAVKYGASKISKEGSIVLFSGVLGQRPKLNTAIMSSVNGAVESLGKALTIELAPIRVNVIVPGYVDTSRFTDVYQENAEDVLEKIGAKLPLGRIGRPEEIAEAVIYLLSNTYTTGSTLYVDGGYKLG